MELLKDVLAADMAAGRWVRTDIRIEDGIISAVEPGLAADGARVVDCAGRFAVPGMIDGHIHLRSAGRIGPTARDPVPATEWSDATDHAGLISRLHSFLYCGVTSIYDAGNDPGIILPLRQSERSGAVVSPRIFCTGSLVTCPGGHGSGAGIATHVSSLPLDSGVLADFLATEPDIVKITYDEHNWGIRPLIPILSAATLRQIIRFCHDNMRRVVVHTSNETRAREAVDAGADALAHPVIQSPVTEEFSWLLAAKRVPVVSTLAIGERYPRLADDPSFVDEGLYADCLGDEERAELRTFESARQKANRWADWMRVMTPVAQENLRALVAAGGTVVAGTDLSLGPDYHRELRLLQDAGITPWDVLRCATVNGAAFLGKTGELGELRPGCAADLMLLDADPAADVANLAAIWTVYKAGEPVDRPALAASMPQGSALSGLSRATRTWRPRWARLISGKTCQEVVLAMPAAGNRPHREVPPQVASRSGRRFAPFCSPSGLLVPRLGDFRVRFVLVCGPQTRYKTKRHRLATDCRAG